MREIKFRDKAAEARWKYRHSRKGLLHIIYCKQRERSRLLGKPYPTYTAEELIGMFINDPKYTRLFIEWKKRGWDKWYAPSVDRINSKKWYTVDNIQIMSWKDNRYKQNMERRSRKGPVLQLKGGEVIRRFISQRQAVKETGFTQSNISQVLLGQRRHTRGFQFVYENKELLK